MLLLGYITLSKIKGYIIEPAQIRRLLAANIKERRRKLSTISQEKLAELMDVSLQTINCIEGCRTWVSDKTLGKLASVLGVEVFQLLGPPEDEKQNEITPRMVIELRLQRLRQEIKDAVDKQFDSFERLK
jgi:transcriptional regulator with XRE-family HTH domain